MKPRFRRPSLISKYKFLTHFKGWDIYKYDVDYLVYDGKNQWIFCDEDDELEYYERNEDDHDESCIISCRVLFEYLRLGCDPSISPNSR